LAAGHSHGPSSNRANYPCMQGAASFDGAAVCCSKWADGPGRLCTNGLAGPRYRQTCVPSKGILPTAFPPGQTTARGFNKVSATTPASLM
jgi:hypothetical protein